MTSKSPVGDISVVTLIRTDTTLDHSQKAEKVCGSKAHTGGVHTDGQHMCWLCGVAEGVVQVEGITGVGARRPTLLRVCWNPEVPQKNGEVTLMRPIHCNL